MASFNQSMAENALLTQEGEYSMDWFRDSEALRQGGLYQEVAKLTDAKPNEVIVDIGTGAALQLLTIAAREPNAITIGTERTRMNVLMAFQSLKQLGLEDATTALSSTELTITSDGKIFWKPALKKIAREIEEVRILMLNKLTILEDNILTPRLLPHLLDGRKIDAGILSMPGGSSARLLEWPFDANVKMTDVLKRQRVFEVTNQTRYAFYHFMSEHVRTDGRIVIAERMLTDPSIKPTTGAQILTTKHMKGLIKYWNATKGALLASNFDQTTVELRASNPHSGPIRKKTPTSKHTSNIAIIRYDRNDVPFDEEPLPRPS